MSILKKVVFVQVKSNLKGFGVGKGIKYIFEDVRNIILEKAKEGYTYKGYVPVEFRGTGDMTIMDLVFEKEE